MLATGSTALLVVRVAVLVAADVDAPRVGSERLVLEDPASRSDVLHRREAGMLHVVHQHRRRDERVLLQGERGHDEPRRRES